LSVSIYTALESDVPIIYALTVALAKSEQKPSDQILVTEERLRKWGFGPNRIFHAIIANWEKKPVGVAVYFYTYAGYLGQPVLFLEDLFVLPEFRSRGIGKKMLQDLANIAQKQNCCRMQWAVFDWNQDAIRFYEKIGATVRKDLLQVRLEPNQFDRLLSQ